jgi:tetratricopeptide (TPR) repeat protein
MVVLAGFAGAAWVFWPADEASYPDSPFEKVGAEFPEIDRASGNPNWDYLTKNGAIQRATPEEQEAIRAFLKGNYPRTLELSRTLLKKKPDSVPGRHALAGALFYGEDNLLRALFHVRKVRRQLEERGQQNPKDADSREWYIRTLDLEYLILRHLDRSAEQVRVVELLGQVYRDLPWLKVWPLAKLKRYDEARQCIDQTEKTGRFKSMVLNDRSMLAGELQQRKEAYEAALAVKKAFPNRSVFESNLGEAALGYFRLEECEQAYRAAARLADQSGGPDFYGTPYHWLSLVYLQQAQMPQAWEAVKRAKVQRDLRKSYTLEQDQGRMAQSVSLFLLAQGRAEEAVRFARRVNDRPDRAGFNSSDETRDALTYKLLLWTALQNRLTQLDETAPGGLLPDLDRKALDIEAWTLKRQLLKLLAGLGRRNEFRPYLPGGASIPTQPWMMGSLIGVLPSGVATVAIREAREKDKEFPEAAAYYDAFEAEAALARGRAEEALALARKALEKLPAKGEKLLRARTAAVAAEAARQLGNKTERLNMLSHMLTDFPAAVRLVPTVIPVTIKHDGTPLARLMADRLLGGPRFRSEADGFSIVINGQGGRLTFEMSRLGGERHFQDGVEAKGNAEEVVAAGLKAFYEKMMSPTMRLTAVEIYALDDSAADAHSQDDINHMLKGVRARSPMGNK